MSSPVIGIIGLGIMGDAMAQVLLAGGHKVTGFDVAPAAKKRFKEAGGKLLASAAAVGDASDIVIVSLATSAALKSTVESLATCRPRDKARALVVVETSTLPLEDKNHARDVLQKAGMPVLDCPISGTGVRIKERAWTIFCSGPKPAYQRVEATLRAFTDKIPYVGVYGNGTKMKYAANHLVAIYNVACAESVNLARKMGLDPQDVVDLFANSPVLGHGVMRLRMPFMVKREYLPATMKVEVWQKDMQVIGDMAKSVDCPTPLFTTCASIYTSAMAQGLDQHDTASVSEVYAMMAGVPAASPKKAAAPAKKLRAKTKA